MRTLLEHRFWIPSYAMLLVGMWIPGDWRWMRPIWVPTVLGGILFFTSLRIPIGDVVGGLRDMGTVRRAAWMTVLKLLLLPLAGWGVARLVAPDWAPGVALVCAMPAGLSSVALTDLHRGDRVLALFLILATSLISPFTVPAGMALIHPSALGVGWHEKLDQAFYIFQLLAIPFLAAQAIRTAAPAFVSRWSGLWGPGAILCLIALVLIATAANRDAWRGMPPQSFLLPLLLACIACGIAFAVALSLRRLVAPRASTAFACAALYMNNGLSIAYATKYYPDQAYIILPCVLMQVPMVAGVVLWGRWARSHDPQAAKA